jgi:hypothetical protein
MKTLHTHVILLLPIKTLSKRMFFELKKLKSYKEFSFRKITGSRRPVTLVTKARRPNDFKRLWLLLKIYNR